MHTHPSVVVSARPYVDKKGKLPNGVSLTLQVVNDDFDYGVDKEGKPRENNLFQNFDATVLNDKIDVKKGDMVRLLGFDAENSYATDNMKSVVIGRDYNNKPIWQKDYARRQGRESAVINTLVNPSCLIIDEVGRCVFDKENTRMFFDVIDGRYSKEGPNNMIFTSNKSPDKWGEYFRITSGNPRFFKCRDESA